MVAIRTTWIKLINSFATFVLNFFFAFFLSLFCKWRAYEAVTADHSSHPRGHMAKHVLTSIRGRLFFIQLNRPDVRNCINRQTVSDLKSAFTQFEENNDVSVGIIHGSGGNFCAGRDISELKLEEEENEKGKSLIKDGEEKNPCQSPIRKEKDGCSWLTQALFSQIQIPSKPLIAAIDGYAVAEGLELALFADLRIIEETSVLGVFGRRFGVPLTNGGSGRLTAIVGLTRALDLILTGRPVSGTEAGEIGLATKIVTTGTVLGSATNLAESLVKFPQGALKADKASVYESIRSLNDQMAIEAKNIHAHSHLIVNECYDSVLKFTQSGIGKHGKFALISDKTLTESRNFVRSKLIPE